MLPDKLTGPEAAEKTRIVVLRSAATVKEDERKTLAADMEERLAKAGIKAVVLILSGGMELVAIH